MLLAIMRQSVWISREGVTLAMIIWLNGAFGAGKTQTAYELRRRLERSYVYDPENAGYFIRDNVPSEIGKEDFQDYPMWRSFNVEMLDHIAAHYEGVLIVPMTVTNRGYFDEIIGELSKKYEVRHFILWASRETLLKRLASRLEGGKSWGARQIDRCLEAFDREIVEGRIDTDDLSIDEVVDKIAALSGLTLMEDRRNGLRRLADRLATQYRHIR